MSLVKQLLMNEASSPPLRSNLHMTTFMSPRASSGNLTAQYLSIASDDMVESRWEYQLGVGQFQLPRNRNNDSMAVFIQ